MQFQCVGRRADRIVARYKCLAPPTLEISTLSGSMGVERARRLTIHFHLIGTKPLQAVYFPVSS